MVGALKGPHFALQEAKALAAAGKLRLNRSSATEHRSSATEPILAHMKRVGAVHAYRFAKLVIGLLTDAHWSEAETRKLVPRFVDQKLDVYGIRHDDVLWYVKFGIEVAYDPELKADDQVAVCSMHPARSKIETKGGVLEL